MKKVIYDCDNTMGVKYRDVDDALTIFYLLGREDVNLLGITTTFGNDTVEVVYETTMGLLRDIDHGGIPLIRGGVPEQRKSEAAEFLASAAGKAQEEITIIATGALTNLYGASLIDPDFFSNVSGIIVMGGITEPLFINGEKVDELNFSCDPEATYEVMKSKAPTTVITGNLCLSALFGKPEFHILEKNLEISSYQYIYDRITPWRDFMNEVFKIEGFYNWDVLAGVYATNPELFVEKSRLVQSGVEDYKTGFLKISASDEKGYMLNIPSAINDIDRFNDLVFRAWNNVGLS